MSRTRFAIRRWWWRRFHPLVRIGWVAATAGKNRPMTQTAIGLGLMGAGMFLRRNSAQKPIYTHVVDPGRTVRIRVYRGESAMSDTSVRT